MPVYLDLLMLLNFLVDLLLLLAADRLSGHRTAMKRMVAGAAAGGVYGGICMLPGFTFLAGTVWRVAFLALVAAIAYGLELEALRRGILFVLLSMALGGVATGLESGGFFELVLSAAGVLALCVFGFQGKLGAVYIPVKIPVGEGEVRFRALRDTGNCLKDPITGATVLVVSPRISEQLCGLRPPDLEDPARAMGKVSGLRLIPYSAVGKGGGLLAAKRYEDVQIGGWKGSCLVAFSPNELGRGQPYEALTGGGQ